MYNYLVENTGSAIESTSPFQNRGRYHIETSPLICLANQWTGFYMITVSVLKGLNRKRFTIGVVYVFRKSFSSFEKSTFFLIRKLKRK